MLDMSAGRSLRPQLSKATGKRTTLGAMSQADKSRKEAQDTVVSDKNSNIVPLLASAISKTCDCVLKFVNNVESDFS